MLVEGRTPPAAAPRSEETGREKEKRDSPTCSPANKFNGRFPLMDGSATARQRRRRARGSEVDRRSGVLLPGRPLREAFSSAG